MKFITRKHIEMWADTHYSKGDLPTLISRLIYATTPSSTQVDFPSGITTNVGGWDGVVICKEDTPYITQGTSLFEISTQKYTKKKANDDYKKRKKNPLRYNPKECTFIIITARFWKEKDKWVNIKKEERFWKDIRVFDSSSIEQWLEHSLAVSKWFSIQPGVVSSIPDGILIAEEFWEEWSEGPNKLALLPAIVISGREDEQKQLIKILRDEPTIKGVRASTKNEAIAFIIATAKKFEKCESDRFFSKTLIIDTEEKYRSVRTNKIASFILIPKFDERQSLYAAVSSGHHVLVPLGADDVFNQETIILSTIDEEGQINSLIEGGIPRETAEKFSKESGRDITILKKLLGFPNNKAKWHNVEDIYELIPIFLMGRWVEDFPGDIELIEKLSEKNYSSYSPILNKWKYFEESPIIQIGKSWRLTSPLDLWTIIAKHLTQNDIQKIQECFYLAFNNGNTSDELNENQSYPLYYHSKEKYSRWAREGIIQTLILIACNRGGLLTNLSNPQQWVDNIIGDLLNNASAETWISVANELPLLSEASPISFLKAVENSLSKDQPEILEMFKENEDIFEHGGNHTGLLWALEGLAWFPESLLKACLILLKLSRHDPGGSLSNRPINSIFEIFMPWHFQTLVSYVERMDVLKYITKEEKESGWNLLIRILPEHHGVAHSTHKMRWRMFDTATNFKYNYQETWKTYSQVIDLLIKLYDNNEYKLLQLLEKIEYLDPILLDKVLNWIDSIYPNIEQKKIEIWDTIRKMLSKHRSCPTANWAMSESELIKIEELFCKFQPLDVVNKYLWLFNDLYPKFPEGTPIPYNDFEHHQNQIDIERNKAVKAFIDELGLMKTLEIRKQIQEPHLLGLALAAVTTSKDEITIVSECLNDDKVYIKFIHGFVNKKSQNEGLNWIKNLTKSLQQKGFENKTIYNIFIPIKPSIPVWDYISSLGNEIENEYWGNINPSYINFSEVERVFCIKQLIKHKRFITAINICYFFTDLVPTDIFIDLLTKAGTEKANEETSLDRNIVRQIFETLYERNDIDNSVMINIEWLFQPLFYHDETNKCSVFLQEKLSKNPKFFIDVLKLIYKSKDDDELEEKQETLSDQDKQNMSKTAYHLLRLWKKIPGMDDNFTIDNVEIKKSVDEARSLAIDLELIEIADVFIGRVLAKYPENCSQWPQECIFELIENINTESLKDGYHTEMFNKRGSSIRGVIEGGDSERVKASFFRKMIDDYKNKYPNTVEIFKNLESWFIENANRIDEEAERAKLEY